MRKWTMAVGLMAACMLGVVPMQQEAEASGLVSGVLQDIDVAANVLLGGHAEEHHAEPQHERSLVDAEAAIGGEVLSEEKAVAAVVCADISLLGGSSPICGDRPKDAATAEGQDSHPLVADISVRSETPLMPDRAQDSDSGLNLTENEGAAQIGLAIDVNGSVGNGDEPVTGGNVGNGSESTTSGNAGIGSGSGESANGQGGDGLGNGDEKPVGSGSQPLVVGLSTNTSVTGESALTDETDSLPKTGGWMDTRIGYGAALLLIVLGSCLRVFGVKSHETRS